MDQTAETTVSEAKDEQAPPQSDMPAGKSTTVTPVKAGGSSDEKAPDSGDNGNKTHLSLSKGKKRKKSQRDLTAPRQPLTGYMRFLNDRREKVRAENPNLPFSEITKLLAGEWGQLPPEQKRQYLDAAEQDREKYTKEMEAYKKTDAYKIFRENQKKNKEEKITETLQQEDEPEKDSDLPGFQIPIFTEEFLDHNKLREAELRQLRKSNTDYEQQNATLQKHIENMKAAVDKLEVEIIQQRSINQALQQHLDSMRSSLSSSFANIPLPGSNETPTVTTIDSYMSKLHNILLDTSLRDRDVLLNTVKSLLARMDFQT